MSWQDRHYNREQQYAASAGGWGGSSMNASQSTLGGFSWRSITAWLIILNVAVFFLNLMLGQDRNASGLLTIWGHFSYTSAVAGGQLWRFITYQFLHANTLHLFFNMFALYMFGPMIERHLGSRRYLAYYLLCGVAGAAMYLLLLLTGVLVTSPTSQMVGASAGIFGILAGAAVIAPDMRVMLLIPPVPVRLRTLAIVFLVIAAFTAFTNGQNAGGEAAHLGGAIAGLFLIRKPRLLNFANTLAHLLTPRDAAAPDTTDQPDRKGFNKRVSEYISERDRKKQAAIEAEIDRILAKVKAQGLHSLTDAEKQTLQQETNRQRSR